MPRGTSQGSKLRLRRASGRVRVGLDHCCTTSPAHRPPWPRPFPTPSTRVPVSTLRRRALACATSAPRSTQPTPRKKKTAPSTHANLAPTSRYIRSSTSYTVRIATRSVALDVSAKRSSPGSAPAACLRFPAATFGAMATGTLVQSRRRALRLLTKSAKMHAKLLQLPHLHRSHGRQLS